jgi:hypothetical protein
MSTEHDQVDAPAERRKVRDMTRFLPFGENLRAYLDQTFVKDSDLSELLRARGVFVQGAEKEDLVLLLVTTLISPSEFESLLECRRDRDSKEKIINRRRSWKSTRTLQDAANASVNLSDVPFENSEKCKLIGKPVITAIDGDPNNIELNFTIQRTRMSMDWSNEDSQYSGKVILKKEEIDGHIVMTIKHTSPETKDVAEKYAKLIEDSLQASGDIGDPSQEDQILFSSFDNIQRADFFLSLTGGCGRDELVFEKLTHLDAHTVPGADPPDSCKNLVMGLEQLKLRGELHKSAYLQMRELYPFIYFYRMDARFKFKVAGAEGECAVRYEFADFSKTKSPSSEFTHEVEIASFGDKFKSASKPNVRKSLQDLIARIIAEKFKSRTSQVAGGSPSQDVGAASKKGAQRGKKQHVPNAKNEPELLLGLEPVPSPSKTG